MMYLICPKVHRRDFMFLNIMNERAIQDACAAVQKKDLIFLILPNEGEIFQNIQDEVKMLDVEVEKKCLCKIPFTPGRGQTGATI